MVHRLVARLAVALLFVLGCATSFVVGRTAQVPAPGPQLTSATRGGLRMLPDKNSLGGQTHLLTAGMVGYVKLGDKVRHKTGSKGPATTLMIWVPGDDGDRLAEGWQAQ